MFNAERMPLGEWQTKETSLPCELARIPVQIDEEHAIKLQHSHLLLRPEQGSTLVLMHGDEAKPAFVLERLREALPAGTEMVPLHDLQPPRFAVMFMNDTDRPMFERTRVHTQAAAEHYIASQDNKAQGHHYHLGVVELHSVQKQR